MMKDYSVLIKGVGTAIKAQAKAQDKTQDARFALVADLYDSGLNLADKQQDAEFKLQLAKAYPKGVGKGADETQKKQLQAVRQVVSTFKKGGGDISPHNFESYSQYRNAVYGDQSKSKMEQIKGWIDSDKIDDVTVDALLDLINEYKAIQLKVAA